MKAGVRVVECVADDDPGSEGRLLREVLNLMEVPCELIRAKSIDQLISAVSESPFKNVHVSTHGVIRDQVAFKGWWSAKGTGSRSAFSKHEDAFTGKCVVSTACMSGADGFGKHVVDFLGAKFYIAPKKSPSWHNAALFSHIFYFKLYRTKRTVAKAFESYASGYKNPHQFKLFLPADS